MLLILCFCFFAIFNRVLMNSNKVLNHFEMASFSFNRGPSENEKGSYFFSRIPIGSYSC